MSKFVLYVISLFVLATGGAAASPPGCAGKMMNPLADIDLTLMGSLKIGPLALLKAPSKLGEPPEHKTGAVCACKDGLQSGVGFGVVFWMPAYINDVARQAGCMGFLNGINILPMFISLSSGQEATTHVKRSEGVHPMQIHYADADIFGMVGKELFEKCNAMNGGFYMRYLTEVDFVFQNDIYSAILTPQVALLAKNALLSQMACGYEGIANTLGEWQDMGICGWDGTRLPLTANAISKNSAQVSNMDVTLKYLSRAALDGTQMRTMGDDVTCTPKRDAFYNTFQNRYQWAFPGKTATRFNKSILTWGLFIKDEGQYGIQGLASLTSAMTLDATATPASGSQLANAADIIKKLPKPLNYPTKEAGYMEVWEARQCCMKVITLQSILETMLGNILPDYNKQLAELYEYYKTASAVYDVVKNPLNAITQGLGAIGSSIMSSIGEATGITAAGKGIAESLSNLTK